MTNTNTWNIVALNCQPDVNGMLDYVVKAHWDFSGTDGTYTGSIYGTVFFEVDPDKPNYTHYADLTLNQVVVWVQEAIGEEQIAIYEKAVADQIEAQSTPPIVTLPLPWVN